MGSIATSFALIVFVLLQHTVLSEASIWDVDIDESPAPSPGDGPPFSAHASRDRALLPAQIGGIVGAYLASATIVGTLLLTIGRQRRRRAQAIFRDTQLEMVKPVMAFDEAMGSPASQPSWYSPRKFKKRSRASSTRSDGNPGSPRAPSMTSFNHSVLEADRAAREQELENLYAAALAEEESKSQTIESCEVGATDNAALAQREARRPPKLMTTALSAGHLLPSPHSPNTTRSPIRAIYPPDSTKHGQTTSPPISPMHAGHPPTPRSGRYPVSPLPPASPSRLSHSSSLRSQASGHGKRFRRTLRNLYINNPMPASPGDSSDQEARTPLTPRYPAEPDFPPSPQSRSEAPTTPATYRSSVYEERNATETLNQIRDVPLPAPQRKSSYQNQFALPSATSAKSRVNGLELPEHATTSTSTIGTLPFRAMSSQNQQQPPSSARALQSPGFSTKVTYLERRRDMLNPPRTGQATPYSPYMPFTPVTPVTPHLTSRAERKQRRKEMARRAPAEEDRVPEEGELWGSGY
ncbi:hypothetical protein AAFC00_004884 [Neodothiora populina]|uniref:Uncharacterized protein n=1 Tax=Neodothiora populina TaxID=2781224 RepID=A0ABR3P3N8_9PEZI